jgi:ABC transport system ATP-binding/permease protein
MWKLTIEDDEGKKTLLPLVRDEYHVGRGEGNTVRLTERNVSRRHASLKKDSPLIWHLFDHSSYNGCYVNGERVVGEVLLKHSDLIQLGDYRIFITNDELSEQAGTSPNELFGESADRLLVVMGPKPGAEFRLDQGPVTIGRSEECSASLNHPSVSRVHAEVHALGNGRYEIVDSGSANGIRVNGTDLRRGLLESGDLIEMGDVQLRFLAKGQYLRPGAGASQQIDAFTERASPSARPPSSKSTPWVKIGIGAVVALTLLAVALFFAFRPVDNQQDPSKSTANSIKKPTENVELAKAKQLAEAKDWNAVHKQLARLTAEDKKDKEVKDLYRGWAEWALDQAAKEENATKKRSFLDQVAGETEAPPELRKKASDQLTELDKEAPATNINNLPKDAKTGAPDAGKKLPLLDGGTASTADPKPPLKKTPGTGIVHETPF